MSDTNNQNQQNNNQNQPAGEQTPAFDYEKLAGIINGKQRADEDTILKNYFKNQGMSPEEMTQAIAAFKDQKAKNTPDVAQLQSALGTAQKDLLEARVNAAATKAALKQGVALDSVEYLLRMADFKDVTDENGSVKDDAVAEAVKKVLEAVPALKGTTEQGGDGFRKIGGDGTNGDGQASNDALRRAFGLKPKH